MISYVRLLLMYMTYVWKVLCFLFFLCSMQILFVSSALSLVLSRRTPTHCGTVAANSSRGFLILNVNSQVEQKPTRPPHIFDFLITVHVFFCHWWVNRKTTEETCTQGERNQQHCQLIFRSGNLPSSLTKACVWLAVAFVRTKELLWYTTMNKW